jgi:hypothetical protein
MALFDDPTMEALREFSKHCRKCKHIRLSHAAGKCIATIGTIEKMHRCGCKEFVPDDNLDYVEWLAKKKGLV